MKLIFTLFVCIKSLYPARFDILSIFLPFVTVKVVILYPYFCQPLTLSSPIYLFDFQLIKFIHVSGLLLLYYLILSVHEQLLKYEICTVSHDIHDVKKGPRACPLIIPRLI